MSDDRNLAVLAHLSAYANFFVPVGSLIIPLGLYLWKKDEPGHVREAALEALNFQITSHIVAAVGVVLSLACVGYLLLLVWMVFAAIVPVVAAIAASNGEIYRYPLTIRLLS